MKLKLSQIVNSFAYLSSFSRTRGLNAKISYNLAKTFKECLAEAQSYEKIRIEKLEELAEKNTKGEAKKEKDGSYKLSDESKKIFGDEMNKLLEQEIEIYCTPISISEVSKLEIGVDVFVNLDWLFVDDSKAEKAND